MSKSAFAGWGFLLAVVLFCVWYTVAANYSYGAVSGTYNFRENRETSTLILKEDRSFQQELSSNGKLESARGSWRRIGEGGVVFSKEFLRMTGQEVRSDGQADGEVKKKFGLFLSIHLSPDPGGPVFHKQLFR
jgi:hypothetical protein